MKPGIWKDFFLIDSGYMGPLCFLWCFTCFISGRHQGKEMACVLQIIHLFPMCWAGRRGPPSRTLSAISDVHIKRRDCFGYGNSKCLTWTLRIKRAVFLLVLLITQRKPRLNLSVREAHFLFVDDSHFLPLGPYSNDDLSCESHADEQGRRRRTLSLEAICTKIIYSVLF